MNTNITTKKTPKPQNLQRQGWGWHCPLLLPWVTLCHAGTNVGKKSCPSFSPRGQRKGGRSERCPGGVFLLFLLTWVFPGHLCVSPVSPPCCSPGVFTQGVLESGSPFWCFLGENSPGEGTRSGGGWDLSLVPTGSCSGLQPCTPSWGVLLSVPATL